MRVVRVPVLMRPFAAIGYLRSSTNASTRRRTGCGARDNEALHAPDLHSPALRRQDQGCIAFGSPTRISCEKSGEAPADLARELTRLRVLSSANGRPPVTMRWRSYISSSPLPLSRMRQSHGMRSPGGCCVRMLVVQLVVTALYQRGLSRSAVERMDVFEETFARLHRRNGRAVKIDILALAVVRPHADRRRARRPRCR